MADYEDPSTWRGRTAGGIPYKLLAQRGDAEYNKATATEEYLIHGHHLLAFIFESFPPPRLFNGQPLYIPRAMPGLSRLVTRRVTWEPHVPEVPIDPFNVDPGAVSGTYHPIIKVTITYDNNREDNPDQNAPETFLEISADTACTVLNVSVRAGKWQRSGAGGTGDPDDTIPPFPDENATLEVNRDPTQTIPKLIPHTEWSLTWPRIDRNWFFTRLKPVLDRCMGRCNESSVEFLNAPIETLLFVGWSLRDQRYLFSQLDDPTFDWTDVSVDTVGITLKFLSKDHYDDSSGEWRGHNHFWRDETGQWERAKLGPDERDAYELADLNLIFRPDPVEGLNA